jgi:hypothetical protein
MEFLQFTDAGMDTFKSLLIIGYCRVDYRFLPKTKTKIFKVVNSLSTNGGQDVGNDWVNTTLHMR